MFNNDDQRQLENLKSQIPILSQRIQNFAAEINENMHREGGDAANRKIEELTAQVINYQERMNKIEHAIIFMMKIRAERKAEEERKSEAEQVKQGLELIKAPKMIKDVFSVSDIAKICKVSRMTVNRWLKSGDLKGYKFTSRSNWRVNKKELLKFMSSNNIPLDLLKKNRKNKNSYYTR